MSKKDNFSQAMYEMFGLGKAPEDGEDELEDLEQLEKLEDIPAEAPLNDGFETSAAAQPAPAAEDEPVVFEAPVPQAAPAAPVEQPAAAAPASIAASAPEAQQTEPVFSDTVARSAPVRRANCTYFAEGTSMEGTLRSDSDVEICGDFKGEIASDGRVTIHANTTSSIAALELVLVDCTLIGDAMVGGDVSINEASSVAGNIRANNVVCSGTIKGNLNVQNNITLTENAIIVGDIKTGTLAMSRGAKVSGKIDMGGN